ncbi:MAG: C1 family peptidase [Methanothrix sp.]
MILLFSAGSLNIALADDEQVPADMRGSIEMAGGNWSVIEPFLFALSSEDRQLVIETYPARLAELNEIQKANKEGGANWTAGLNPMFLLPPEKRGGVGAFEVPFEADGVQKDIVAIESPNEISPADALPTGWDWRSVNGKDWTTPIKNQNPCGSCWAFAAVASVESRIEKVANNPDLQPDLSEQSILSCSPGPCSGWYSDLTANWITCKGTVDEACFPYVASKVPCSESCFDRNSRNSRIEGWNWVCDSWNTVDVERIKQEIYSHGPVQTYFAVYTDFDAYKSGIYTHTSGTFRGGHFVSIVGWGSLGGVNYWICKNSWGTGWGDSGWFKIKMGDVSIGTQAIAYDVRQKGKVLFYEGHNPISTFYLSSDYAEWGRLLARNGYIVESSSVSPLTSGLLNCYDALIISNPSTSFTSSELDAIKEFVGQGRVIAIGDGSLFKKDFIYKQDNERIAVEYVDRLSAGEGHGLLIMGEYGDFSSNTAINQVANKFGIMFNQDEIFDSKRYDSSTHWPILGPNDDVEVLASCSLTLSKDTYPLARTTSSGYVNAASAGQTISNISDDGVAAGELILTNVTSMNEAETSTESASVNETFDDQIPPVGAGIPFTGPIAIAELDLGRNGEDNIGLFRPSTARWYLDYDNSGFSDFQVTWGESSDKPVAGDWNGDGKDEIGLFRPSTARWYLDYDNSGGSDFQVTWGESSDKPIAGDWDGDGKDEIGLFRPSTARWYLDYDNSGGSDFQVTWGESSDKPIAGDWDGDGKDEIGLFRPSTATWYLDYDNSGLSDFQVKWGKSSDIPVAGDWDGDGKDEIGLFRPSTATWYLDYDNSGGSDLQVIWGESSDMPIAGDWLKI